jgi:predicted AAA+ superfamily ATPase
MKYYTRLIDRQIELQLRASGAVLIRGVKGSGKTETGRHHSKSEIAIDDSPGIQNAMQSDPGILLAGDTPRLIDEWQEQPRLWNTIRHEIDRRRAKGQFILTGSSNPEETASLHSGVGRFGVTRMRTMSRYENTWSTGEVSLKDILDGKAVKSNNYESDLHLLAEKMAIGGWPAHIGMDEETALMSMQNYFELLCEVDLSRVSNIKRDPDKVRRVMRSLARNIATETSIATIAADAGSPGSPLANDTVKDYLGTLDRLMVLDDLPGWRPQIRTRARLRGSVKRHLADTSLVIAALGLDSARITGDLNYMGFLFESSVIHDLRIYAESLPAALYHYRDSNGVEADAILEMRNGAWAAFEIKIGIGGADNGAASLLKLRETIDTEKFGEPLGLVVITGSGFAHRRPDGVTVVPIQALKP